MSAIQPYKELKHYIDILQAYFLSQSELIKVLLSLVTRRFQLLLLGVKFGQTL